MSKIAKAAEEILEKISFGDYKKPKFLQPTAKERRNVKKKKLTLYLTEAEEKLFDEIFINRLKQKKKSDRSALFAEAVALLHKKEFS
jgi:hypothetical protein